MLQIAVEQMQAMESQTEANFARRLADSLTEFFPFRFTEGASAVTEEFALTCVHHAKTLGLRSEAAITRYANLCALMGIGFEAKPFAAGASLCLLTDENPEPAWLDRIVPIIEQMLRERASS